MIFLRRVVRSKKYIFKKSPQKKKNTKSNDGNGNSAISIGKTCFPPLQWEYSFAFFLSREKYCIFAKDNLK